MHNSRLFLAPVCVQGAVADALMTARGTWCGRGKRVSAGWCGGWRGILLFRYA